METQILIRLIIGLAMTAIVGALAVKRVLWLTKLISSGQPTADERGRKNHLGERIGNQVREVFGQTKLLKWSIPGIAHFFTMWGFFILASVYLEAYGVLFDPKFHIPFIGRWGALGFLQDFFAVAVLLGIIAFAIIRLRSEPKEYGRASRFYGSHTGGAWLILFMIFNVIWTYALFRGAAVATGNLPYDRAAFFSHAMGSLLTPLGLHANEIIETVALLLHIGVMLVFLLIVLHSKHLHIGLAPLNVTFKRLPNALGPLLPMESKGEYINFEDPAEDAVFGRGKIEDFTWKGYLDLTTCTECGRCQSQCPAWNTGKPLSPKLVIMDLRDHLFAKAPYIFGEKKADAETLTNTEGGLELAHDDAHHVPESGFGRVPADSPLQATRPLVGDAAVLGVIDPDVLWSCTTCGACVEQCPVDIEHIDHIVDMRRYQVMMESEFPGELGGLYKNLETKGNPWGQNSKERLTWIDEVDFDVPVYGKDVESFAGFEYLFWVGCAGALDDRAKKTTKAVAELLAAAGVKFLVLGDGETCTGDSARRSGNEFLFQQLAAQNVETMNELFSGVERVDRKVVVTCPHCFNTLGREYPQVGGSYTVLHHTQLLNRLVRDKKLVPVTAASAGTLTYHDPCYLGRHNKVYEAPRELIGAAGATLTEMPRHAERGFCCGAGGARMWMEEHLGTRVNHNRVDEALTLDATTIATGCPFCRVMLSDGVGDRGKSDQVEVVDVAQLLLGSLDRGTITLPAKGTAAAQAAAAAPAVTPPPATTEPGPVTAAPAVEAPAAPATAIAAPAAPAAPAKGLGLAAGAKRPGAKKATAPAAAAASAATPAPAAAAATPETPAAPAAPAAPAKGLGIAAGAKRPGAKKAVAATEPAAQAPAAPAPAGPSAAESAASPTAPSAPVKGLGIAAGVRRPGARKAIASPAEASPAEASPAEPAPTGTESAAAQPTAAEPTAPAEPTAEVPPVKGLGIAKGARPPGKRS